MAGTESVVIACQDCGVWYNHCNKENIYNAGGKFIMLFSRLLFSFLFAKVYVAVV